MPPKGPKSPLNSFSKVLYIVALNSLSTRALNFLRICLRPTCRRKGRFLISKRSSGQAISFRWVRLCVSGVCVCVCLCLAQSLHLSTPKCMVGHPVNAMVYAEHIAFVLLYRASCKRGRGVRCSRRVALRWYHVLSLTRHVASPPSAVALSLERAREGERSRSIRSSSNSQGGGH
jgi:hypothetical protein